MAIHLIQIGEVVQFKGIKQRKHGSADLKMMPIALPVWKGQPVAAVLGRADGIGIIFVLSSFRMVSIHSVILRFDLNFWMIQIGRRAAAAYAATQKAQI